MREYPEKTASSAPEESFRPHGSLWLTVLAVLAIVAAGLAVGYASRQQALVSDLTSHVRQMNMTVEELKGQLNSVTGKLNDMVATQQQAAAEAQNPSAPAAKTAARQRANDKRLKQLQTRLDAQQKQLQDTRDQVAKTRSDLEGNISSTRDELNGSIARTHEELVALQKRGERNYVEFDLTKSRRFQRFGPLMLSLRKADTKHKSFDLALIVDDNELNKKKVNLYEPIWIHRVDDPQPVQVVINKIEKDRVHGYVSAPKYRNTELASNASPASEPAPMQPSPISPAPSSNPEKPEQPQP